MSVPLRLPGPLRELAGGRAVIDLDDGVRTAGGALAAVRRVYPALYDRIVTEQGEVRPHVNVFVGNTDIRHSNGLDTHVPDGTEILILPAVSGG